MKKSRLSFIIACALCGSMLFSSCVGSFALFNKVSAWNRGVGSKFVNELVFLALNIIPVYEVASLVDVFVINSIEFWSGSNPVAKAGDVKQVKGNNGNYLVETTENGYSISKEGEDAAMQLIYDEDSNIWSVEAEGETHKLVKMNGDDTATLYMPNGDAKTVTLDANGLMAAHQLVEGNIFYAAR